MKRKLLSLLLVLCMVISLLPVKISASPAHELYVGGTNVTDYTHEISYWKVNGGGYSNTGNESDYDFSVSYNSYTESFTLTLNGVNISNYHQEEVSESETINYGVLCTTALNIYLNDGTENSIAVADTGIPYGIYTPNVLTINGDGNLTVVGNGLAIQTGICGVNGVIIEGGESVIFEVGYSITANSGPITVSGGKVEAYASESGLTANNSGITISGGRLTATGNSNALYTTGSVSVTANPYKFRTNTESSEPETDYTLSLVTEFANSNTLKYVEIISCDVYVGGQDVSGVAGAVTYWLNDGNGGITATDANADHYNVKYDGFTQTLTLFNANLTGVHTGRLSPSFENETVASIFALSRLNIVLEGENHIAPDNSGEGIVSNGGLDFSGDGSLINDAGDSAAIAVVYGDINIHSGSIDVKGTHGIYAGNGNINIHGGNISVEGIWYGIDTDGGDINIYGGTISSKSLNNRDTSAVGAYNDGYVNICGGTVIAEAVGEGPNCYGVFGNSSVEIFGGTVIASAVGGTDHCYGVYSDDYVEIFGGAVYAQGGTAAYGVRGDPTDYISPSAAYDKYAVIMTKKVGEAYTPTVLYNNAAAPVVFNVSSEATERVTDLWVGGFPFCTYDDTLWDGVDNANYGDYFHDDDGSTADGDYAWSVGYDTNDDGYDLFLNGINIRKCEGYPNKAGICANDGVDMDIFLVGTSSSDIVVDDSSNPSGIIMEEGNLRIYGTGTLNMRASFNGIWVKGNLAIEGGTINAIGGNYGAGIGVYGDLDNIGNFEINAATVNACGYCGVITNAGTISVNGGTLTAKGDDENYGAVYGLNQVNPPTLEGSAILGAETGGSVSGGVYTAGTLVSDLTNITWSDSRYREGNAMLTYVSIAPANVVTCVPADNGSFTAKIDGIIITHAAPGDTVTLTAAPNSGYLFSSWNVYKTDDTNTTVSVNGSSFTMPAYPVTIEAVFAAIPAINPTMCNYNLNAPADVTTTITWNAAQSVTDISYGDTQLTSPNNFSISGNTLTIKNGFIAGLSPALNDEIDFEITFNMGETATLTVNVVDSFVPVTGITEVPTILTVGTPLTLTGTVAPANATNQTIVWSVADVGTTGATISGNTLTSTAAGTVTIRATITNGLTSSSDYILDFAISVNPIPTATVTFNSNGTVYNTKTVNVGESIGSAAWPANPTRSGFTFSGWFTDENGAGTEFISSIPVNSTITIYAKWTYIGSNDSTPPPPQRTITVTETSSDLFTNTIGTITAEANMDNAFSNSVEVKLTDTTEDTASFKLSAGDQVYPFDISLYIKGTNTRTEPAPGYAVTISLPIPENLVDKRASLLVAHKADDGRVTTLNSKLVQKDGIWYLVFEATEFSPYALVVRNLGSYDESIGVPYYTDTKGNKVFIGFAANGKYIAPEGVIVSVMQNDKSFIDITGHLAAPFIGFTTERELFFGTGGNKFSPDIGMTRAMFATVIGRLYERSFNEIALLNTHFFTDCDYGKYYGKYTDWAADNKIIVGIGGGKFAPDMIITREQMAAVLYRFADFLGVLPGSMDTVLGYPDAASISSYAKDAVLYCQTTEIMEERSGGVFAPQETATRAEVAAIIQKFIEIVVK